MKRVKFEIFIEVPAVFDESKINGLLEYVKDLLEDDPNETKEVDVKESSWSYVNSKILSS